MCVLQWSMLDPSQIPMLHWLAVGSILKYCFRGLFLVGLSKNLHWIPLSHITQCGKKIFRENRIQCNFTQICKKKNSNFVSAQCGTHYGNCGSFLPRIFRKSSVKSTFLFTQNKDLYSKLIWQKKLRASEFLVILSQCVKWKNYFYQKCVVKSTF